MGEGDSTEEPAEESSRGSVAEAGSHEPPFEGFSIFSLSGGIMRPAAKTANRIDGLLAKMLTQPRTGAYVPDIDKNLDYLFTSLQLDMITMATDTIVEEPPRRPAAEAPETTPLPLQLGPPLHDDSREV